MAIVAGNIAITTDAVIVVDDLLALGFSIGAAETRRLLSCTASTA